jgi:inner membrane protein
MELISSLIDQFGVWLWFAMAVILLVLETIIPGLHFVWFGIAAVIVGMIALAVPMAWQWQLILFTLIALLSVFWMRRNSRADVATSDEPNLNVRGAQYIGRRFVVDTAIVNGTGRVRVGDTVWAAEGEDAPAGASVEVTGVNGTRLVVVRCY